MKDFDEARHARNEERRKLGNTFRIAGEEFSFRVAVRPDHFFEYDSLSGRTVPMGELIDVMDGVIIDLLEGDDAAARWQELRQRKDDPITLADMTDLMQWLVEQVTGRPFSQSPSSQDGSERTGTPSTENDSSAEAAA